MKVDLNCDLGEGIGVDSAIIPLITSANVCCGWHAGTEAQIRQTLELCLQYHVTVGAHPGYPDREHFGRRELNLHPTDIIEQTFQQVQQLRTWCHDVGLQVRYIKPHGALYHQVNKNDAYADALISAAVMASLPIVGLPGSRLQQRAEGRVPFVAEGFADRRYTADGQLVPRDQPDALLESPTEAVAQVMSLLERNLIDTVCVHGDHPLAVQFVQTVRDELIRQAVELKSFT